MKENETSNTQNNTSVSSNPSSNQKPITIILYIILAIFLSITGFLFGKYTNNQQSASQTKLPDLTPKKFDYVEIQRQQNEQNAQKTSEDIKVFRNSTLLQHSDLQNILQNSEIQGANKFTVYPSNANAWVIDTIDKSYLKGNQLGADKPRHQYLVTSAYWMDTQEPLAVECITGRVFPVTKYNDLKKQTETSNLLIDWSCSIAGHVSLFNLETGKKIPLSDPKNLVPSDNSWIITKEGNSSGRMEPVVFGKKPIFLVNYGGGEPFGTAIFSAKTGQLLQLTLYKQFNQ